MCEDYRAGASVDLAHDDADREAGRQIACPVLVLWAARGALPRFYADVLEVWRPWAPDLRGEAFDATHFLAEDRPEETAAKLLAFLAAP
jgi:haloacetate dehalogenase